MIKFFTTMLMIILSFFGINTEPEVDLSLLPNLIENRQVLKLDSINEPLDYWGYVVLPSEDEVLQIIGDGDVLKMDSLVKYYDIKSRTDYRYELHVKRYLKTLSDSENPTLFLGMWKKKLPNSPYLDLAYVRFYTDEGWRARGTGWMSDVPVEDRTTLQSNLKEAYDILEDIYKKDSLILYQWNSRFRIAQTLGMDEYGMHAINQSLKINPYQFLIRSQFQYNLMPRWGGRRNLMAAYADRCDSLSQFNYKLTSIRATIYEEQGLVCRERNDTSGKFTAYAKQLEYDPLDYNKNGWVCEYYWNKKEYKKAVVFSRNLVTYFPEEKAKKYYLLHAKVLYACSKTVSRDYTPEEYLEILKEIQKYLAMGLDYYPNSDEWAVGVKGWIDQRIIEKSKALLD